MALQRVHLIIGDGQPAAGQRILMLDRSGRVVGELAGEQAHPSQNPTDRTGRHRVGVLEPGDAGDVPGEGTHPLHLALRQRQCRALS